jgi:hypothetical protein
VLTISFRIESALEIEPELRLLIPSHMEEFERYGPPFEPAPNFEAYRKIAQAGALLCVTARDGDRLVGYWLGLMFADVHHKLYGKPAMIAMAQAHYILSDYRPHIAKSFFSNVEVAARRSGASLVVQRIRPEGRSGDFLEAIGYKLTELVYAKSLVEPSDA